MPHLLVGFVLWYLGLSGNVVELVCVGMLLLCGLGFSRVSHISGRKDRSSAFCAIGVF